MQLEMQLDGKFMKVNAAIDDLCEADPRLIQRHPISSNKVVDTVFPGEWKVATGATVRYSPEVEGRQGPCASLARLVPGTRRQKASW